MDFFLGYTVYTVKHWLVPLAIVANEGLVRDPLILVSDIRDSCWLGDPRYSGIIHSWLVNLPTPSYNSDASGNKAFF